MWRYGMGYGGAWMWLVMAVAVIGFWVLVALVVRAVIQGRFDPRTSSTSSVSSGSEPLRLLDERLARGEIGIDEYQRIRNVLTGKG